MSLNQTAKKRQAVKLVYRKKACKMVSIVRKGKEALNKLIAKQVDTNLNSETFLMYWCKRSSATEFIHRWNPLNYVLLTMAVMYTVTGYIIATNWMLWHKVIKSYWMKKANTWTFFYINISPPFKKVVSMSLSGFFIMHVCHSVHATSSLQSRGYWGPVRAWVAAAVEPCWTGVQLGG